jgi:hypothetical protein
MGYCTNSTTVTSISKRDSNLDIKALVILERSEDICPSSSLVL